MYDLISVLGSGEASLSTPYGASLYLTQKMVWWTL